MSTILAEPPAYLPAAGPASASSSSQDLLDIRSALTTPPPAYTERASCRLLITAAPGEGMLNASILDSTGRALYSTASDAKLKKTTLRRAVLYPDADSGSDECLDMARVGWDRSSPRVRFLTDADGAELPKKSKKRKVKCKDWLPRVGAHAKCLFFFSFFFFFARSGFGGADSYVIFCRSRELTVDAVRYTITERKGADGTGYVCFLSPVFPAPS